MGELTKFSNTGKCSPGPVYNYRDEVKYIKVSPIYLNKNSHLDGPLAMVKEEQVINLSTTSMRMLRS
jgi:hypothetical protein